MRRRSSSRSRKREELVPDAEVVAVSAKTGSGLDDLRAALARAAAAVERAGAKRQTRLYVDRSFSLRGIGTVVTGTLGSGTIGVGDELRLEPSGRDVRVRSVQVHDREVERAESGQRVAVSLPGVERSEVVRGDALVEAGAYAVSYRLDLALEELEPIADGARVTAHVGTAHVPARVVRVGERWAQLRLVEPVVAARGDRVVLRGETTLGGGTVVDPAPPRHRDESGWGSRARRDRSDDPLAGPGGVDEASVDSEPIRSWSAPATGSSPAPGWTSSHASLRARIEAAEPDRSRDPGADRRLGADVLPLLPFERRGARLYAAGAVSTLGEREADAEELGTGIGRSRRAGDERRGRRARALPRSAWKAHAAGARARDRRVGVRRGKQALMTSACGG